MKLVPNLFFLHIEKYMLPCLTKKIIGIDCPGCGLQRAVLLLLKGEFGAAFTKYPPIYALLSLVIFFTVSRFIRINHANKIMLTLLLITTTIMIANYILKFI